MYVSFSAKLVSCMFYLVSCICAREHQDVGPMSRTKGVRSMLWASGCARAERWAWAWSWVMHWLDGRHVCSSFMDNRRRRKNPKRLWIFQQRNASTYVHVWAFELISDHHGRPEVQQPPPIPLGFQGFPHLTYLEFRDIETRSWCTLEAMISMSLSLTSLPENGISPSAQNTRGWY
jgi:hypothetical protein